MFFPKLDEYEYLANLDPKVTQLLPPLPEQEDVQKKRVRRPSLYKINPEPSTPKLSNNNSVQGSHLSVGWKSQASGIAANTSNMKKSTSNLGSTRSLQTRTFKQPSLNNVAFDEIRAPESPVVGSSQSEGRLASSLGNEGLTIPIPSTQSHSRSISFSGQMADIVKAKEEKPTISIEILQEECEPEPEPSRISSYSSFMKMPLNEVPDETKVSVEPDYGEDIDMDAAKSLMQNNLATHEADVIEETPPDQVILQMDTPADRPATPIETFFSSKFNTYLIFMFFHKLFLASFGTHKHNFRGFATGWS